MNYRHYCLILLVCSFLLTGCSGAIAAPQADILVNDSGCTQNSYTLTSDRSPQLLVSNRAADAMVVTIPDINNSVTVPPGEQANLELHPYIWGDYQFFCLTDSDHTAVGGAMNSAFVCGIDAYTIKPYARSSGSLTIERHDRVEQLPTPVP